MDIKEIYKRFTPVAVEVKADSVYIWCGCGKSGTTPFDDGKHDCQHAVEFKADLSETRYLCACGQTGSPPFCDGSHGKLLAKFLKDKNACQK